MAKVFIGIGSNLGNAKKNCLRAINSLRESDEIKIIHCSSLYKTEPVGIKDQNWFVNCAVEAETALLPENLLFYLKKLEVKMGRVPAVKWGSRVIDFDILFFDNKIINSPHLKVPHPLNHVRRFVLDPMGEIAPNLIHPVLNKSINELKKEILYKNQKVELLSN